VTYFKGVSSLPEGKLYVIITNESVWIPGDERSRTAPGHGYPASTHSYAGLEYFEDEATWLRHIDHMAKTNKEFRAFAMQPALSQDDCNSRG
jgi:hypothetical protein